MKKHFSQMNNSEIKYLKDRFRSLRREAWSFTGYSNRRSHTRELDLDVFNSIWKEGFDLIEFHHVEDKQYNRILVRSIACNKHDEQLCVVFNFTTKKVITVYWNKREFKHDNLDWSEYDSSIDIKKIMKGGK